MIEIDDHAQVAAPFECEAGDGAVAHAAQIVGKAHLVNVHTRISERRFVVQRRQMAAVPFDDRGGVFDDIDAVIDTRAVFQQGFRELDHAAMPTLLRPAVGRYGLTDYEKIFCADLKRGEDIFAMRGIDRAAGCVVIVRPDQYVGHVLPLHSRDELTAYFGAILRVRG